MPRSSATPCLSHRRRPRAGAARIAACCGLLLGVTGLLGCEQRSKLDASKAPPPDPDLALGTPEDAARTLLHYLGLNLEAAGRHDHVAADRARDQIIWHIAARDELLARFAKDQNAPTVDEVGHLNTCVESWAAMISYYQAGLALDEMRVELGQNGARAAVSVPARAAERAITLRIGCVRGSDGQWAALALEFGGIRSTTMPAVTRPASLRPASAATSASMPVP